MAPPIVWATGKKGFGQSMAGVTVVEERGERRT